MNLGISTTNNTRAEGDLMTHLAEFLNQTRNSNENEQVGWENILLDIVKFNLRYQYATINQLPIDAMPSSSKVILVIRKPSRCDETFSLNIIGETIIVEQY